MKRFDAARADDGLWLAAQGIGALFRGEDSSDADLGAVLLAEYVAMIRAFLTKKD